MLRLVPPSKTERSCQVCGVSSLGSPFGVNGVLRSMLDLYHSVFVVTRVFKAWGLQFVKFLRLIHRS